MKKQISFSLLMAAIALQSVANASDVMGRPEGSRLKRKVEQARAYTRQQIDRLNRFLQHTNIAHVYRKYKAGELSFRQAVKALKKEILIATGLALSAATIGGMLLAKEKEPIKEIIGVRESIEEITGAPVGIARMKKITIKTPMKPEDFARLQQRKGSELVFATFGSGDDIDNAISAAEKFPEYYTRGALIQAINNLNAFKEQKLLDEKRANAFIDRLQTLFEKMEEPTL